MKTPTTNPNEEIATSNLERTNWQVATRLDEVAQILEEQGANKFRVKAYRRAAGVLRELATPIDELIRTEGLEGLQKLPGIGETLARFIHQLVATGRLPMLDRLRGESDPIALLCTVAGIGRKTAERLHDQLGIETLEELEIAAHDGRLAGIWGFGEKRLTAIRETLATRLGRVKTEDRAVAASQPTIAEILDVDREYRQKSSQDLLPKIAPKRFNPRHEKWLPILHTTRGRRHYTAMFSNTPRAHELNKTSDWVIIYYDGGGGERQCTAITSTFGPLQDKRIIRGREVECLQYYRRPSPSGVRHSNSGIRNGFSI